MKEKAEKEKKLEINGNFLELGEIFISTKIKYGKWKKKRKENAHRMGKKEPAHEYFFYR